MVTQLETLLRLSLALIAGGALGYERSAKRVDAGFRIHIIVCVSSCAIMLTNLHLYFQYGLGDLTRMPAQVISGVGFLGAGCILITRQRRFKGVTPAAGLWSTACLGLCIGAGAYVVAIFVLVTTLLTMTVFQDVESRFLIRTKYMRFYMELESPSAISDILKHLRSQGVIVRDVETVDRRFDSNAAIVMDLKFRKKAYVQDVISELEQKEGVVYVSEF